MPDEFYEDLIEALEDYSFFDFLESDFRFDVEDAKAKFLFPAFRYGMTIAYTFPDRKNKLVELAMIKIKTGADKLM